VKNHPAKKYWCQGLPLLLFSSPVYHSCPITGLPQASDPTNGLPQPSNLTKGLLLFSLLSLPLFAKYSSSPFSCEGEPEMIALLTVFFFVSKMLNLACRHFNTTLAARKH
jgi:hypothetical protein